MDPQAELSPVPAVDGMPDELRRLVQGHMKRQRLALCPEIATYEADMLVPFWEAVDAIYGKSGEPPFWGWSWPGSQALARYLLDHPEVARDRLVLDLGAGNGLAAIAAGLAGACRVLANDVDTVALWIVRLHAAVNGIECNTDATDLLSPSAEASHAGSANSADSADLILVGDLFYSRPLAEQAEPWLRERHRRGARVLIGEPGRAYALREDRVVVASYEVQVTRELESSETRVTRVLELR